MQRFRDVTAASITLPDVKKHTRSDSIMSEVMDIVTHGRKGDMTPRLKLYMVR